MGSTVMMYVLPMLLGQTYDLGKEKPGILIYPNNVEKEAIKIERYFTDSQYRMVENVEQIRDLLDVSGQLSLKIKSGMVNIGGEGRYLKESSSKSNGIEILIKLHFETVTLTIPSSKKPNADWSKIPESFLGTHYCRSLTFGGDLVASIRITGSGQYDQQRIKGAISGGLKTSGGGFEGDIKGKLEMLKQSELDSSSMEINYYASVPIHGVSYTVDGLLKLIDDFPKHVKKVNGGLGNPLRMELYPLSFLKEGLKSYEENRALKDELSDMEKQFDDLRNTRKELALWISELPPTIPDTVQKSIDEFSTNLNKVYSVYINTISELDMSQGASTDPVKKAFEAYKAGGYSLPLKYTRGLRSLQKETYKEVPELQPKIYGAHYIRWGENTCNSSDVDISFSGVMVASSISELSSNGGSSDLLCSPSNVDEVNSEDYFENHKPTKKEKSRHLGISPIKYKGGMSRFNLMLDQNLACVHCRVKSRTAMIVKMAARSCPDGWTKEYEGYIMASGSSNMKFGEYVCVDKDMKVPNEVPSFGGNAEEARELLEVTANCGALPCDPYKENKPIPCVVCTI